MELKDLKEISKDLDSIKEKKEEVITKKDVEESKYSIEFENASDFAIKKIDKKFVSLFVVMISEGKFFIKRGKQKATNLTVENVLTFFNHYTSGTIKLTKPNWLNFDAIFARSESRNKKDLDIQIQRFISCVANEDETVRKAYMSGKLYADSSCSNIDTMLMFKADQSLFQKLEAAFAKIHNVSLQYLIKNFATLLGSERCSCVGTYNPELTLDNFSGLQLFKYAYGEDKAIKLFSTMIKSHIGLMRSSEMSALLLSLVPSKTSFRPICEKGKILLQTEYLYNYDVFKFFDDEVAKILKYDIDKDTALATHSKDWLEISKTSLEVLAKYSLRKFKVDRLIEYLCFTAVKDSYDSSSYYSPFVDYIELLIEYEQLYNKELNNLYPKYATSELRKFGWERNILTYNGSVCNFCDYPASSVPDFCNGSLSIREIKTLREAMTIEDENKVYRSDIIKIMRVNCWNYSGAKTHIFAYTYFNKKGKKSVLVIKLDEEKENKTVKDVFGYKYKKPSAQENKIIKSWADSAGIIYNI